MHFVSTFTCTSDAGLLPHFKTPRTPTACSRIGSTSETIISRANKIRNIGSAIFSLNNSEQSNYPNAKLVGQEIYINFKQSTALLFGIPMGICDYYLLFERFYAHYLISKVGQTMY